MPKWKSPLRKGMYVICEGGMEVEVLADPWEYMGDEYGVDVYVHDTGVKPFKKGRMGLRHSSRNRFGSIKILSYSFEHPLSVEEDFFTRQEKPAPTL